MKLNTKSRVAIKALLDLAAHGAHVPVALASIAERQAVSLSYLEQLFRRLRLRGLVKSSRGPGGGYQLNKRLSAISVADVILVVDGEGNGKRRLGAGSVDALWVRLERELLDRLRTITLESLMGPIDEAGATTARSVRTLGVAVPGRRNDARTLVAA